MSLSPHHRGMSIADPHHCMGRNRCGVRKDPRLVFRTQRSNKAQVSRSLPPDSFLGIPGNGCRADCQRARWQSSVGRERLFGLPLGDVWGQCRLSSPQLVAPRPSAHAPPRPFDDLYRSGRDLYSDSPLGSSRHDSRSHLVARLARSRNGRHSSTGLEDCAKVACRGALHRSGLGRNIGTARADPVIRRRSLGISGYRRSLLYNWRGGLRPASTRP